VAVISAGLWKKAEIKFQKLANKSEDLNLDLRIKKSDALVWRVNTFIILNNIEGTVKVRNLYEKTLKIYKFQNLENVVLFL
jgi:hypothetical protein